MKKIICLVLIGSLVFLSLPLNVMAKKKKDKDETICSPCLSGCTCRAYLETLEDENPQKEAKKKWKEMNKQEKKEELVMIGDITLFFAIMFVLFSLPPDNTGHN